MRARVLALFDIDGTLLLKASAAHAQAVLEAMGEVYGLTGRPDGPLQAAGRTDLEIARQLALLGGVSAERFDDGRDDFRVAASEAYARLVPDDLSAHVAPGIVEVLEELDAREGVRLAVLTGNLEPIAHLKLARAGLGRFFEHGQGGFGSDSEDRLDLPASARRRAGGHPRADTVVIGDTPRDIACARAAGVRVIAVTTGPFDAEALRHADKVCRDVREVAAAL
jgi:phosphoglycolate phosphatase-like HAD superfamily hydrolase